MSVIDRIVDTRPLRGCPAFRRLWLGTSAATLGGQVVVVAVLLQVWQLTGSPFWVAVIGLAQAVPMLVGGLIGGALADAVDRRRLVITTTAGGITVAALLAAQALAGLASLALVLGLVAAQASCAALGAPARRTFVPRLLPREQVPAGIALTHLTFQAAMLAGPALAGLLAAGWGVGASYLLNALAATIGLYGVIRLPPMPPPGEAARAGVRGIAAGWRFIGRRPVLSGVFLTDLAATLLAMPIALFPLINEERFGGDPRTLGLFLSAVAVGGISASVTSGAVTRAPRPGLVMLVSAAVWGAALAGFGLATPLWLVLGCLAVAGAADTVSVISRGAIVALATPDSYRGRVNAVEHVIGVAGPGIGNFRAGMVAGLTSAPVAAVSGGLLCLVGVAAVAVGNRTLRRFTSPAEPQLTPTPGT